MTAEERYAVQYLAEHDLCEVTADDDIDAPEVLASMNYPGLTYNLERWQSVRADPGAPLVARQKAGEQVARWAALRQHVREVVS